VARPEAPSVVARSSLRMYLSMASSLNCADGSAACVVPINCLVGNEIEQRSRSEESSERDSVCFDFSLGHSSAFFYFIFFPGDIILFGFVVPEAKHTPCKSIVDVKQNPLSTLLVPQVL
jgi:hypothetical protein